ncbi:uncharacterized protein LOC125855710 [Solanum stenotomum]|uniref:uncharacterized protein LOC125855710 n=1 Tax=Solanum stenotomum TaxID=172797 RepID=UPI0020D17603|nr:uncharacterized protein LOC125855710 [Solanum stenotomum]
MNPPEFHGSKVEEDPQEFIDEVYKELVIMGVALVEKEELAVYQLKGVAQIEEEKVKERSREAKRAKSGDGNFSHARFDGNKFRQSFFGQDSSNAPSKFKNRVSYPKPQGGNGSGSSLPMSTCVRYGKKHEGKCLTGTDACFGCGKSGHKMWDCPMLTAKGREGKQALPIGSSSIAPKHNRLYALQTRGEQEELV